VASSGYFLIYKNAAISLVCSRSHYWRSSAFVGSPHSFGFAARIAEECVCFDYGSGGVIDDNTDYLFLFPTTITIPPSCFDEKTPPVASVTSRSNSLSEICFRVNFPALILASCHLPERLDKAKRLSQPW
jgi:hypothetical protein